MESSLLDKMFQPVKSGVEAAKEWLGQRSWLRGTNGNEPFGSGATELFALHEDAREIDERNTGGPTCALPSLLELAKFVANVRAGLDGWETQQGIRAIEAAAEGRTTVQAAPRRGNDD